MIRYSLDMYTGMYFKWTIPELADYGVTVGGIIHDGWYSLYLAIL